MRNLNKFLPFLLPLASLILGIYWQTVFPNNTFALLFVIIFIFLSLFCLEIKKLNLRFDFLICFLFFFCGAFLFQHQRDVNFELLEKFAGKPLDVIAKVVNIERQQDNFIKQVITLDVKKIKKEVDSSYKETSFNLLCYAQVPFNIQIDDEIELTNITLKNHDGKFSLENKPSTSFQFINKPTFYDYLLKENLLSAVFIGKNNDFKIISTPLFSIRRWIINRRNEIYNRLKQKLSFLSFSYFSPIFLGKKNEKGFLDMKGKFNNWGLAHYLARSGLHIVIFILLWRFFLNFVPLPFLFKVLFLMLLCFCYHLLSWPSISLYRAIYIFLFYEAGRILQQQTTFLHLLSLVCLIILLLNPIQLFFLDFQLSFALTFSLTWLSFPFNKNNIS